MPKSSALWVVLFLLIATRKTLNSCETAGTPSWPSLVSHAPGQLRGMGFPDAHPIPLLALYSDWFANQKLLGTAVPTHLQTCHPYLDGSVCARVLHRWYVFTANWLAESVQFARAPLFLLVGSHVLNPLVQEVCTHTHKHFRSSFPSFLSTRLEEGKPSRCSPFHSVLSLVEAPCLHSGDLKLVLVHRIGGKADGQHGGASTFSGQR